MAVLDARASTIELDMFELADTTTGQRSSGSATAAIWSTISGDTLRATGAAFAYSGNLATGGTLSTLRIDLAGGGAPDGSFDVKLTGLSMALPLLTASNTQPYPPLFWDRMLGGNDTLYSPLTGYSVMFGDGLRAQSQSGLPAGGGDDTFRIGGTAFGLYVGDFLTASDDVTGGNDDMQTSSTLGAVLVGDLNSYNGAGVVTGGADFLKATQPSVAAPGVFNDMTGDALTILGGTFIGGADSIYGGNAARDHIIGDAETVLGASATGGKDFLNGRAGADTIYGDFVQSQSLITICADDIILGGIGSDVLVGDIKEISNLPDHLKFGNDVFQGQDGNDRIYGDYRLASLKEVDLYSPAGHDWLEGGAGDDFLYGQSGGDTLLGEAGSDYLSGGIAFDTLDGGGGADTLIGGLDKDTFVFKPGYRADTILDFADGKDKIDLSAFAFPGFVDVFARALMNGNDLEIDFGNGDILLLFNFNIAKFDSADVIL